MKPGETLESAIWLDGRETTEDFKRFAAQAMAVMGEVARQNHVVLGPPRPVMKFPGDDRVPEVPDHIQGPDVRLLVIEADVVAAEPAPSNFLADLEPRDLARLRMVTRVAYGNRYPVRAKLTNRQCDTLINDLGPEAALATLERGSAAVH